MEENRTQPTAEELAEYARKLAQLTARVQQMTPEQRQKYTQKIAEVKERVEKLTPAMRAAYDDELARLGAAVPAAAPRKEKPAAKAAPPRPQPKREAPRPPQPQPEEQEEPEEEEVDDEYEYEYEDEEPVKKKKKKSYGCLAVIVVLLVLFGAVCGAGMWAFNEVSGRRGHNSVTTTVEIAQGSGPLTIGNVLQDSGIIKSGRAFQVYVKVKKAAPTLQYGSFELNSNMSYDEIIKQLQIINNDRDTVRVTFPEGIPAVEFANRVEAAGLCTAEEFLASANEEDFSDLSFWNKRDENPNQFMKCEGYLFPDTYEFFADEDVHNIVKRLYAEFDSKITDEMYGQIQDMGFTLSQFVTLASIVQEEAGGVEHQADVAAVFMNRLAPGSPVNLLQSNCSSYIQNENDNNYLYNTVAWYYGDWNAIPQNIIDAYDTYSTPGLPAGPISNPGLDAMVNTLKYKESPYYGDYYFFVTDTLGNYYFNKTADAHQAQVNQLIANGTMPG